MYRIVSVSVGQGYTLEVEFADGTNGKVDLSSQLFGPVFEPLRDRSLFSQVRVDEYGAVCWPNGADVAPDALYRTLSSRGVNVVPFMLPRALVDAHRGPLTNGQYRCWYVLRDGGEIARIIEDAKISSHPGGLVVYANVPEDAFIELHIEVNGETWTSELVAPTIDIPLKKAS